MESRGFAGALVCTFTPVCTSLHPTLHRKKLPDAGCSRIGRNSSRIVGMFALLWISQIPREEELVLLIGLSVPGKWCK